MKVIKYLTLLEILSFKKLHKQENKVTLINFFIWKFSKC